MKEIALHVLDLVENSARAGAKKVRIAIIEDRKQNFFKLVIEDNGRGMSQEVLEKVKDPFFTGQHKKVGMGVSLLAQLAEQCGGYLEVDSEEGRGTKVEAIFRRDHIDRPPMGDIPETLMVLLALYPDLEVEFEHVIDGSHWMMNSKELFQNLGIKGSNDLGLLLPSIRDWMASQEENLLLKGGKIDENQDY